MYLLLTLTIRTWIQGIAVITTKILNKQSFLRIDTGNL